MVSIMLIALFISQLISFFLIILLNMKVSKFKNLEQKQMQVVREMEHTIDAYLIEMQEENNRLIQELANVEQTMLFNEPTKVMPVEKNVQTQEQEALMKPTTPASIAAKVYQKQKVQQEVEAVPPRIEIEPAEQSFEQQVLALYAQGKSIADIAKQTQKGKTEIELLIKFHS